MTEDNDSPKPEAAKLGWRVLARSCPYQGKVNKLREDRLAIPGRGEMDYSYIERAQSVIIVPLTTDGRLALIRQYRYAVDEHCLEFPAGGCHDTGDASLEAVCRKELKEEIGAVAGPLEYVGWFYSSSSLSDEICHIFLAREVELSRAPKTEPGESIEPLLLPVPEALALARRGEMKTGTCALALLMCEERLRKG